MFTIEQIKSAHSKVKSGADFPAYIGDLKTLGVTQYETFVEDGHTSYFGNDNYSTSSPAGYPPQVISTETDAENFKARLKAHQQGQTDYPTFCNDCAISGIAKWVVSMAAMTCTYYNLAGHEIFAEAIPQ
ncbi:DUF1398 domain-containing protein [Foetidibacter luteolus]|uniref:DUF1398 domain-containing protein n=1 Tax=Foetidibacter luteolus TaxID=2608880 RepID=UPI00129B2B87|nr:DUF1398 family protein [Foetidibacter luteolus]